MDNIEALHNIRNLNVLVFGDFMVDKYISGSVSRISPEAPVPVLEVKSKKSKLGGAGNVVKNIAVLGARTRTIGCIGTDEDGEWLLNELKAHGSDVHFMKQSKDYHTIVKTRLVSKNQQFLRMDEETIKDISDEFFQMVKENVEEIFRNIDVFVISDYAKGAVRGDLSRFFIDYANQKGIITIVDPKGKDYTKYAGATICTPNMNELRIVTGEMLESENDIRNAGALLRQRIDLNCLMITRSEKGITIIKEDDDKNDFPAIEKDVIDVTGAGDTVVSIVAVCMGIGYSVEDCCTVANLAASIVCSKFGAASVTLNELIGELMLSGEFKEVSAQVAKYIVAGLKDKGKRVVMTNGCFDLLHAGHVHSFLQAKKYGDVLIVAVNSDSSVKKIKGDKRPIISEKNRIKMLCSLECVDYVVLMEETTPENIIKCIQPDVVVKGADWKGKEMPEQETIESYGGKLEFIDLEEGLSTTNIIKKISEVY